MTNDNQITMEMIKSLRARTGAGVVDCKTALASSGGDEEKAIKILREQGKIKAAKKAVRATAEGVIGSYIHSNKKVATLVSVHCETDFVARTESFQELARDLAMHVAAMEPLAVKPEDVPEDLVAAEKELVDKEVVAMGKPANIAEGIIKGRMDKFKSERSLLAQPFVKNPEMTVGDLLAQKIAEIGENIVVDKFVRLEL